MEDLLARYHGDLSLALAAYNAGPQMVQRYGEFHRSLRRRTMFKKLRSR